MSSVLRISGISPDNPPVSVDIARKSHAAAVRKNSAPLGAHVLCCLIAVTVTPKLAALPECSRGPKKPQRHSAHTCHAA